jgi:ribonuclease HII
MIIGVDEAGIGTLAGPMVIAAVGFNDVYKIPEGVRDSKKMTAEQREVMVEKIYLACCWKSIHFGSHARIDEVGNIWDVWTEIMKQVAAEITKLCPSMWNVVTQKMTTQPIATVDGNRLVPGADCFKYVVKADETIPEVSAASIVAKYCQTSVMEALHEQYPQYGFSKHNGYPTADHKKALTEFGPSPVHRRCYAPVKKELERRSSEVKDQKGK